MQYRAAATEDQARKRNVKRAGARQVLVVRVRSGVAACIVRPGVGSARTESWTQFASREQFHACWTHDPMRFADPLRFVQLKLEVDDAFDEHG